MARKPYASVEYYKDTYKGEVIPEREIERFLMRSSWHMDTLTYNRMIGGGIEALTDFQKHVVQEVCCMQADFEYANKEIFDMILQGYSINGVSMQFGESWNVSIHKGVPMQRDVYEYLSQTGLCCRLAR